MNNPPSPTFRLDLTTQEVVALKVHYHEVLLIDALKSVSVFFESTSQTFPLDVDETFPVSWTCEFPKYLNTGEYLPDVQLSWGSKPKPKNADTKKWRDLMGTIEEKLLYFANTGDARLMWKKSVAIPTQASVVEMLSRIAPELSARYEQEILEVGCRADQKMGVPFSKHRL